MVYDKKLFRKAAAEMAQAKGITYRKAKQILAYAIHLKEKAEALEADKHRPPGELQGLWRNIMP